MKVSGNSVKNFLDTHAPLKWSKAKTVNTPPPFSRRIVILFNDYRSIAYYIIPLITLFFLWQNWKRKNKVPLFYSINSIQLITCGYRPVLLMCLSSCDGNNFPSFSISNLSNLEYPTYVDVNIIFVSPARLSGGDI